MERVVNRICVDNAKLFARCGLDRYLLAKCEATIEVIEHVSEIRSIGGSVIDRRYATLLITFNHIAKNVDFSRVDELQFTGDVLRQDGKHEFIQFNQCIPLDALDLTGCGTCIFEVKCSDDLLSRLRRL